MKTRRSAASVSTRSSPRLRAQGSACVSAPTPAHDSAPSGARQLIDFPSGASLQISHDARGHFSRLWRNASELLSHAGMNAKGKISRWWKFIRAQQVVRSKSKRLQMAETISLGEK